VFGDGSLRTYQHFLRNFDLARKKAAIKLGNPRLMRISLRTLRHFKATMEYQKTRDILHVMSILGHRSIKNTLVYTHLVNFESDEYVCKVAKSVNDAKCLIENGFEYVTDIEGMKLFRKRK
jgi:integrase